MSRKRPAAEQAAELEAAEQEASEQEKLVKELLRMFRDTAVAHRQMQTHAAHVSNCMDITQNLMQLLVGAMDNSDSRLQGILDETSEFVWLGNMYPLGVAAR